MPAKSALALYYIGDLAFQTGCKVQTIRYYEQIGLLPAPQRTAGNQRIYRSTHADRLAFIRHSRELGFPLESIRALLALSDDPNRSCEQADRIARAHLQDVDARIESLAVLKNELERMIRQCRRGKIDECRVIEVLAASHLILRAYPRPIEKNQRTSRVSGSS